MNMRTELRKIVCFILLIPTLYRVLQTFISKVYMIPCRNFMLRVPPALAARVGSRNLGPVLLRSSVHCISDIWSNCIYGQFSQGPKWGLH